MSCTLSPLVSQGLRPINMEQEELFKYQQCRNVNGAVQMITNLDYNPQRKAVILGSVHTGIHRQLLAIHQSADFLAFTLC